jgi:hypothetical protein
MSEPTTLAAESGWRHVAVGAIYWQPGDNVYPQVTVDWDGDRLDREMATSLFNAIDDSPTFEGARDFIDHNPKPAQWHEPADVVHWLEALAMEVPGPAFYRDTVLIHADANTSHDVTVAVVRWGEDIWDDTQVIAGLDPNLVERELAEVIYQRIAGPDNDEGHDAFLDMYGQPDLRDTNSVSHWLIAASHELRFPAFTTHHATLQPVTAAEPEISVVAAVSEVASESEDVVRGDRVMAEYGREAERVWGPLLDSGIPEMLAEAFPTMPEPADWPDLDGTTSGPMWEAAVEDWMEECLDLAVHAAHVADLLDRLDALEQFQREVAVMLADEPLPREPDKADYLATRPAYEGEFDDMAYRWDRDQWQADFPKAARHREAKLSSLLRDSMRGAPMDRPTRRTDGVEKAQVDALKELIVPGATGHALGEAWLDRDGRRRVSRLLHDLGDRPVVVPGPEGHQYSGLARDAHRWLQPGVYEATGLGGEGRYRLVVGIAAQAGGPGWAAAVDPHDRADTATLDDLAQLRAQAIRNKASGHEPPKDGGVRPAPRVGLTEPGRPGRPDWFGQLPSRPAPGMSL